MTTAVHAKAALAEVLLADGTAANKRAGADRDQTNTVDFGATLTSLIDRAAIGKDMLASGPATSSPAPGPSKQSAHAPTALDTSSAKVDRQFSEAATTAKPGSESHAQAPTALDTDAVDASGAFDPNAQDAPTTIDKSIAKVDHHFSKVATTPKPGSESLAQTPTALDTSAADASSAFDSSAQDAPTTTDTSIAEVDRHFSKAATTPKPGFESRTQAPTPEDGSHTASALSDAFAAPLDNHTFASRPAKVAADESRLHQISTSASDGAVSTAGTSEDDGNATRTSDGVTTADRTEQSADPAIPAHAGVAAMVDSPVPNAGIALDRNRQTSAPKASDDAGPPSSGQVTSAARNPANAANPAHIDADLEITARLRTTDSAYSHSSRANNGTSPALSTQSANWDSMNPAAPKIAPPTFAKFAADATASGAEQSSQKQPDAVAEIIPQAQRERAANSKETSAQPPDPAGLPNDSARSIDAQPASRAPAAAAIRLTPEVTSAREVSHSASITVQLAGGQTAQASVRERAGAVDVKILTPTAASAQRVASEMDGLRQNLDAAGIKLGRSEISYQQGDGKGRGHEGYRPPAANQSANGKEVFTMNEVIQ